MPLYEYECTACGKLTEKRQKFSDPEITECPFCGGLLERTITAPAVQFKGGGWYADLYSKGGKKPATASAEGGTASGDNAKTEAGGKTETAGKADSSSAAAPASSSTPSPAASSSTPEK